MFYKRHHGGRATLRWWQLARTIANHGYQHTDARPGARWWPARRNDVEYVAQVLDLCVAVADEPTPPAFDDTRLGQARYGALPRWVRDLFDAMERLEAGVGRVDHDVLCRIAGGIPEPFLARFLALFELDGLHQHLVPGGEEHPNRGMLGDLAPWMNRLPRGTPFDRSTVSDLKNPGPAPWPERDTLSHVYRCVADERLAQAHTAPAGEGPRGPMVGWCVLVFVFVLVEHSLQDAQRRFRDRGGPGDELDGSWFEDQHLRRQELLVQPGHHLWSCRKSDLVSAFRTVAQRGFVEVAGPPGIGKSAFVRDLVHALLRSEIISAGAEVRDADVVGARTAADVLRTFRSEPEEDISGLGAEGLFARLSRSPAVLWIRSYDPASIRGIQELWQMLEAAYLATDERLPCEACWFLESTRRLADAGTEPVTLGPMSTGDLHAILARTRRRHEGHDANDVATASRGNPTGALWRWWSADPDVARETTSDHFEWLSRRLTEVEKRILQALCFILTRSPLGATSDMVDFWVRSAHGHLLPMDVRAGVASLLDKLVQWQLVTVHRVDGQVFDGLLADVLGETRVEFISDLNPNLAEVVLAHVEPDQQAAWRRGVRDALLDRSEHDQGLAWVTASLLEGDLMPFFHSSFRYTHLPPVVRWLDSRARRSGEPNQHYEERGIRLLHGILLSPDDPVDVDAELGLPEPGDEEQRFVHECLHTRAAAYRLPDGGVALERWVERCRNLQDARLRVESQVYLAQTERLGRGEKDLERAWNRVAGLLLEQDIPDPATRGTVLYHGLAFLNRTKDVGRIRGLDKRAPELRRDLAHELIEHGVRYGNLLSVSNGLFFLARGEEIVAGRMDPDNVEPYDEVMAFVESAGKMRRLQALLTSGSIHRHWCRPDFRPWSDFVEHINTALDQYQRVRRSAAARRLDRFLVTSVNYMMDCGSKTLRYGPTPEVERFVREQGADITDAVREVFWRLGGAEDDPWVGSSVTSMRAAMGPWLLAYGMVGSDDMIRDFVELCEASVASILRIIDWGETPGESCYRADNWHRKLLRSLDFAEIDAERRDEICRAAEVPLRHYLRGTQRLGARPGTRPYDSPAGRRYRTARVRLWRELKAAWGMLPE